MIDAELLRKDAEDLAQRLPPLLADARHLASTVLLGSHGRKRVGTGDEFWQYRQAVPGDEARSIDWRRSARSQDTHFVRQKEWQAAQTVQFWVDGSHSMSFASDSKLPSKSHRAQVLALAVSVLLVNAGERVSLVNGSFPPRSGDTQLERLAWALVEQELAEDFGSPDSKNIIPQSRAVFVSDFLGDLDTLQETIGRYTDRGVVGVLLQVLDPAEEEFPYVGRTRFFSMAGSLEFETQKAKSLKASYLERLAERKAALAYMCREAGWEYSTHHTSTSALSALLWTYHALEGHR